MKNRKKNIKIDSITNSYKRLFPKALIIRKSNDCPQTSLLLLRYNGKKHDKDDQNEREHPATKGITNECIFSHL